MFDLIHGKFWRVVWVLLALGLLLALVDAIHTLPRHLVAAPMIAAAALVGFAWALDWLRAVFMANREKLQALCVGASCKPFHWALGDESHLRRPGGGLLALGPFRFAWRFTPVSP